MQTPWGRRKRSQVFVAVTAAFCLLLAGCGWPQRDALPHVDQRVGGSQATSPQNGCRTALAVAKGMDAEDGAPVSNPLRSTMPDQALRASANSQTWIEVAARCPGRFAEGTLYSALDDYRSATLTSSLGGNDNANWSDAASLSGSPAPLTRAAQWLGSPNTMTFAAAEDRARFGIQVLAARLDEKRAGEAHSSSTALLRLSDTHKLLAQRFASLAGPGQDTRRAAYSVHALLTEPEVALDAGTGLRAATDAVVEMDCVWEELSALQTQDVGGATPSSSSEAVSASTTLPDDEAQARRTLATLISQHASDAFTLGYPALQEVILSDS